MMIMAQINEGRFVEIDVDFAPTNCFTVETF